MLRKKELIAVMSLLMVVVSATGLACGDVARGKVLAEECAACHGDNGWGDEEIPVIAGLESSYLVVQLKAFRSGERKDEQEMMLDYVEDLSDQDMADLAAYWSSRQGK